MNALQKHKYIAAFISALLLDIWFDMCAYAANNSYYSLGILANLTYPLISMVPMLLVIEQPDTPSRLKVAAVEGCGYALGTALFMLTRDFIVKGAL